MKSNPNTPVSNLKTHKPIPATSQTNKEQCKTNLHQPTNKTQKLIPNNQYQTGTNEKPTSDTLTHPIGEIEAQHPTSKKNKIKTNFSNPNTPH